MGSGYVDFIYDSENDSRLDGMERKSGYTAENVLGRSEIEDTP